VAQLRRHLVAVLPGVGCSSSSHTTLVSAFLSLCLSKQVVTKTHAWRAGRTDQLALVRRIGCVTSLWLRLRSELQLGAHRPLAVVTGTKKILEQENSVSFFILFPPVPQA